MTASQLSLIKNYSYQVMSSSPDPQHGTDHLDRVWANAKKLTKALNVTDPDFLMLLQAACYLHDLSTATHPFSLKRYLFESHWTITQTEPFLKDIKLKESEITSIQEAILYHPHSIPWRRLQRHRPLLVQILEDADSIDFFHPLRLSSINTPFKSIITICFHFGQKHIGFFLNQPKVGIPIAYRVYFPGTKSIPPKPLRLIQ